jgi:RNA ligase (TIGR02306 family)
MAEKYGLSGILSKNEGLVLYGEVLGPGIQDLTYGLLSPEVRFFDIFDMKKGVWWDQGDFREWCNEYGLPVVPTLYYGPFNLDMCYSLAEGVTTMGGGHVREGIVVKPERERWDQRMGRVFLKLPGEGYLLRKGG